MTQLPALDPRVLAAYLAAHLDDARVLYVGDLDDTAPFFAAGARLMQVYRLTPPSAPLQGPVLVQSFERGVDVAPGAFDLAIVEDLTGLADRLALLAKVQAAVGARGVAVVVARTGAGGLDYAELFDACSALFEHVTLVGKLPFTGTLLCELGLEEAPAVSVDTELAEHGDPTTLLAVLSQQPFGLDPYAIFAHPAPAPPPAAPPPNGPDSTTRTELSRLMVQNQLLQSQLADAKERQHQQQELAAQLEAAVLASKTAEAEALTLRNALVAALEQQRQHEAAGAALRDEQQRALQAQRQQLEQEWTAQRQQLEQALAGQQASVSSALAAQKHELEAAWASQRQELERGFAAEQQKLKQELAHALSQQGSAADLDKALAELAAESERAERAEAEIVSLQQKIDSLESRVVEAERRARGLETEWSKVDATRAEDVSRYESALYERGAYITALEAELRRRERMIVQLVVAERLANKPAQSVDWTRKLDNMAREVARYRSELEARNWRIQELENMLRGSARA